MKVIVITTFIISNFFLCPAQPDTLNQLNVKGKKQGYWLCYLNKRFKPTDSIKGVYVGFDLYDDGINLTRIGKRRGLSHQRIVDSITSSGHKFGRFKLLDGKILFYNKKNLLTSGEIYSQGHPLKYYVTSRCGHPNTECAEEVLEMVDFTKLFNNIRGTAYVEFRRCTGGISQRSWFRKENGKWDAHVIKD